MKSKKRTSFLTELQTDQRARIRGGRRASSTEAGLRRDGGSLLARAERRVRTQLWLRKTLPLNLLFFLPGLLFVGTRSRLVLVLFVATYPLVFVLRALLARLLSALIGPEEVLVREEYERLRERRPDDCPVPHSTSPSCTRGPRPRPIEGASRRRA